MIYPTDMIAAALNLSTHPGAEGTVALHLKLQLSSYCITRPPAQV